MISRFRGRTPPSTGVRTNGLCGCRRPRAYECEMAALFVLDRPSVVNATRLEWRRGEHYSHCPLAKFYYVYGFTVELYAMLAARGD
eukprot:4098726-Prymnesium_polylepis.1